METSHFSFDAFGPTRAQAVAALRKGFEHHCQVTGATMTWRDVDYNAVPVALGKCYRDGQRGALGEL
jgi:hypothetical protein